MQDQFNIEISPRVSENIDNHYESLAQKYRLSSVISGIVAGVLVLLMLLFGYKEFTYENIFYFIKDFDNVISSDSYNIDYIEYGSGENRRYHCYRGGIVASGKYDISVYSSAGRRTATFNDEFVSPNVCVSLKYILAFDIGGNSFSVYNSFLRLYSETLDTGIYSAYVNDLGDFLIHTSTSDYRSVVYHYNDDFERVAAYYFVDYVTDAVISNDGKHIYITTMDVEKGEYIATVNVYKTGKDQIIGQYCVQGAMPLSGFEITGGFCLLTEHTVVAINNNAEATWRVELDDSAVPQLLASGNKGLVLMVKNKNDSSLMFISSRGDTKSILVDGSPIAIDMYDSSAYLLYNGTVIVYDFIKDEKTTRECPPDACDILVLSDGEAYLCYSTRAIYCRF